MLTLNKPYEENSLQTYFLHMLKSYCQHIFWGLVRHPFHFPFSISDAGRILGQIKDTAGRACLHHSAGAFFIMFLILTVYFFIFNGKLKTCFTYKCSPLDPLKLGHCSTNRNLMYGLPLRHEQIYNTAACLYVVNWHTIQLKRA